MKEMYITHTLLRENNIFTFKKKGMYSEMISLNKNIFLFSTFPYHVVE